MGAQQALGLVAAAAGDGAQDAGVFVVGGVDAGGFGEVQPADDADALGDVGMHPQHLAVAAAGHQAAVEVLVQAAHFHPVGGAFGRRHQPHRRQLGQGGALLGLAQALHRVGLQQDAQVVQRVEGVEVQRRHLPAQLGEDLQEALTLQPLQGLAQGGAADGDALGEVRLREAFARHQHEVVDQLLDFAVGLLGQRGGLLRG